MSRGADLLTIGWQTLLDEHGIAATYTPTTGAAVSLYVLDNGSPEDIQQLAMQVDGVSRIVTATRSAITAAVGATVAIGATTYKVIAIRPRSDFAIDMMLGATAIAGNKTGTTFSLYYGASASTTLTAAEIKALTARTTATPAGSYAFTVSGGEKYLYLAWPNASVDQPAATVGFTTGGLPMGGDTAGTAEGYTLTANGWGYKSVTVDGAAFRLYRTKYTQASGLTIQVIT